MNLPIDKSKSDAARAEGNASFKKGRWTESIGHYTNAILHNPEDPLAYGNRAQAYLRLDKYADAERDSTIVLEQQKDNVKALYRRSLARKGLERYHEAISDLHRLLELEPKNETALEEMEELRTLRDQAAAKAKPRKPLSPTKLAPGASSPTPESEKRAPVAPIPSDADSSKPASSSFASLKSSRASKKPAYIPPTATTSSVSSTDLGPKGIASPRTDGYPSVSATSGSAPPAAEKPSKSGSNDKASTQETTSTVPRQSATAPCTSTPPSNLSKPPPTASPAPSPVPRIPQSPTDPTSTAPGTGILLLRALTPLPPASAWALLRLYPPQNIPVIIGPILEPDSLGTILLALGCAVNEDRAGETGIEEDRRKVKVIMDGLRKTPRIDMNAMMLDSQAAKAGEIAWRESGGQGSWP